MIELEVGQVTKIGNFYLARVEEKDQIYKLNKILTKPQSCPENTSFFVTDVVPGVNIAPGTVIPATDYLMIKDSVLGLFFNPDNHAEWFPNLNVGRFAGPELRVIVPPQDTHEQEGPTLIAGAPFLYIDGSDRVEIAAGLYVVVLDKLFLEKQASMEDDPLKAKIKELVSTYESTDKPSKLRSTQFASISMSEKIN